MFIVIRHILQGKLIKREKNNKRIYIYINLFRTIKASSGEF